jgi:nitroreductase
MHITEAIRSRKSVRAFKAQPVPLEIVKRILQNALRAPSGTNTQPWHVYVCTGEVRDAISRDVLALMKAGKAAKYEDFDYYPSVWKDEHRDRRRVVGWDLYGLLGIQKGDREASFRQSARNFKFFDAPVGLFFTVDAYLGRGSWLDAGMFIQTVMLAARAEGLHTCPQAAWIRFQKPIMRHLKIPDDQVLISGMSLGYEDEEHIVNTLVSKREPLESVASFYGFD